MTGQVYTDKEILGDALTAEKTATNNYNTFANECVHENVRHAILHCLKQEHDIQQDVFCMMHEKDSIRHRPLRNRRCRRQSRNFLSV